MYHWMRARNQNTASTAKFLSGRCVALRCVCLSDKSMHRQLSHANDNNLFSSLFPGTQQPGELVHMGMYGACRVLSDQKALPG